MTANEVTFDLSEWEYGASVLLPPLKDGGETRYRLGVYPKSRGETTGMKFGYFRPVGFIKDGPSKDNSMVYKFHSFREGVETVKLPVPFGSPDMDMYLIDLEWVSETVFKITNFRRNA